MKQKTIFIGILLSIIFVFSSNAQQDYFPVLKGLYLGQKPPGMTPEIFAEGIVSTKADEYAFEISSSGDEMMFIRKNQIMLITRNVDGTWNKPFVAPFSGKYIDDESFFSPSGNEIYFMSRRNCPGSKYGANLWVSRKNNAKWTEPEPVKITVATKQFHAPSISSNGNIYEDGIVTYKYENGKYLPKEKISHLKGMSPFISPDESFIIYAARLPGKNDSDLFISFYNPNGTWSEGVSLGAAINTKYNEGNTFVTADGKYLFFSRKFDIYWISANIIEKLRQQAY